MKRAFSDVFIRQVDESIAPAWEAMKQVDVLTFDADVRRGVAQVRDGLRTIENAARKEAE